MLKKSQLILLILLLFVSFGTLGYILFIKKPEGSSCDNN
jgi:hypothetical protein